MTGWGPGYIGAPTRRHPVTGEKWPVPDESHNPHAEELERAITHARRMAEQYPRSGKVYKAAVALEHLLLHDWYCRPGVTLTEAHASYLEDPRRVVWPPRDIRLDENGRFINKPPVTQRSTGWPRVDEDPPDPGWERY